jgi:hypothetical protein
VVPVVLVLPSLGSSTHSLSRHGTARLMDLLRLIALRALGVAHWGNDLRLLGAALIKLEKRTRNLEARVSEFDLAGAETGSDA